MISSGPAPNRTNHDALSASLVMLVAGELCHIDVMRDARRSGSCLAVTLAPLVASNKLGKTISEPVRARVCVCVFVCACARVCVCVFCMCVVAGNFDVI